MVKATAREVVVEMVVRVVDDADEVVVVFVFVFVVADETLTSQRPVRQRPSMS